MKRFRYERVESSGVTCRGVVIADSLAAARDRARAPEAILVRCEEVAGSRLARAPRIESLAGRLRGLGCLLEGGVPLDVALGLGGDDPFLSQLRQRVRDGASLSAALATFSGIPAVVVGLVRAGERSGLGGALEAAAAELERLVAASVLLRSALAYPVLLLGVGSVMVLVILTTVLPRFAALFADLGQDLPTSTTAMLAIGDLMRRHGIIVASATVGAVILGAWALSTPAGHRWRLRLPLAGSLTMDLASARVAQTLGTLLAGGVPALDALGAAADAAANPAIADRVRRAAERVRNGMGLGAALRTERAMDTRTTDLVSLGERSGRLPALLQRGAQIAARAGEARLNLVLRLIEPALIVGFAGVVGFVALAMLQALYGVRIR